MSRSIPWTRVLVEGVVVVGSILLAFAIDAWWEEARDRAAETELLAGLEAEFQEHLEELGARSSLNDSIANTLTTILRLGVGEEPWPESLGSIIGYGIVTSPTWDPGAGVREALVTSGRLELISNSDLRVALSSWRSVVDEVRDGELLIRELVRSSIIPKASATGVSLSEAGLGRDLVRVELPLGGVREQRERVRPEAGAAALPRQVEAVRVELADVRVDGAELLQHDLAAEQIKGLDPGGALVEGIELLIPKPGLGPVLGGVAVAAVYLHCQRIGFKAYL